MITRVRRGAVRARTSGTAAALARTSKFPVHIRATGTRLAPASRDYLRRKLDAKLGKFAASIERVSVRVEDVNGPRGGVDQSCRIKVVLTRLPSVVFESRNSALNAALDLALTGVQRAVRRATTRRRTNPRRS